MEVKSCKVIYFSPTDTTKKILNSIVEGLNVEEVDVLNLNKYDRTKKENIIIDSDIVIMGAPVYGERIANEASKVFEKIKGQGKLAIIVAVYGNMSPGVALEQLYDISTKNNLKVVGMGNFIGEHSFATEDAKVGYKRPNSDDLSFAREFGKKVKEKLINAWENTDITVKLNSTQKRKYKVLNNIFKLVPQRSV